MNIQHLRELKPGWDSYDGVPPREANIWMAVALVNRLCPMLDVDPDDWALVPCPDGSLQAELHRGGWDIEIHVNNRRAE